MAVEEEMIHGAILSDEPEPWEEWESGMVIWCFGIAIAAIAIFGFLVNSYIL